MFRIAACLMVLAIVLCLPLMVYAADSGSGNSLLGSLLWMGGSLAASWITGAGQKRGLKSQGWRNAIPATNSAIMGGITAGLTENPRDIGAAVVGALLASGSHRIVKRVRTGRW
jgi:hypothetical protein